MKLNLLSEPLNLAIICCALVVSVGVVAVTLGWMSNHKASLMAKDVQLAMEKGIDPIIIRCAYAAEDDRQCLVFATARGVQVRDSIKVIK